MANVDVINPTWDMINEKEGAIVYGRTKFPKLAKPLLIDRFAEIIDKYEARESMTTFSPFTRGSTRQTNRK